jgi:hypothetical protein
VFIADGEPMPDAYAPIPKGVTAVAVGWLDAEHDYSRGSVEDGFVARLSDVCCTNAVARTRGFHRCPFCPPSAASEPPSPTMVERGAESVTLGSAEVHVVARDGRWLVAPNLVLHYVTDHGYVPPPEFIEAVTSGRVAPTDAQWR